MVVQPYLIFDGRCEEALGFYRKAVGAEIDVMLRFKDSPDKEMCVPGSEEKVMHSSFRIGTSVIMASDGRCLGQPKFDGFSLSITATTKAEAERLFSRLGEGGQVEMPLMPTFFSPGFGIVSDRFGVSWMIVTQPQQT